MSVAALDPASEVLFQALSDHIPDACFLLHNDHILKSNPAAAALFGCTTPEAMTGCRLLAFAPAVQADGRRFASLWREQVREARTQGQSRFPCQCHKSDGAMFSAEVSLIAMRLQSRSVLLCVLRDLTEDAKGKAYSVNQNLTPVFNDHGEHTHFIAIQNDISRQRQAEERGNALFEGVIDACLLVDATGIVDCNRAAITMLRYRDKAEVLALPLPALWPEFQPDGSRSIDKAKASDALAREQGGYRIEWTMRRSDGSDFIAELVLNPISINDVDTLLVMWHDLTERKRLEEALLASEHLMREIIKHLPTGAVLIEGERLHINPAIEELTGYTREELPTLDTWFRAVYREKAVEIRAIYEQNKAAGHAGVVTIPIICKDDTTRYVQIAAYQWDSGEVWHIYDVTANFMAEQAIRENEVRLKEAQAVAQLGSWRTDGQGRNPTFSDEMYRLCSMPVDAVAPSFDEFYAIIHPDDLDRFCQFQHALCTGGTGMQIEYRILRPDGKLRHMLGRGETITDGTGKVVEIFGTMQDITDRKEQEIAMASLSRRNELLLHSIGEGVYGINLEGKAMFVNPVCCALLGYTEAEMLGQNMHELLHHSKADGTPYPVTECPIFRGLQQGRPAHISDEVFWRKDGTPLDVEYTSTTIYEADKPAGTVVSFRDTTERRRAAEALRYTTARLAQAQEVARIGSWELELATRCNTWSEQMFRLFDFDPAQGTPSYDQLVARMHFDDAERHNTAIQKAAQEAIPYDIDFRVFLRDGTLRWLHALAKPETDAAGRTVRLYGTVRDITEAKMIAQRTEEANRRLAEANSQLEQQIILVNEQATELEYQKQELEAANTQLETLATTDGLTGIKNHRAFQERLTSEVERSQRHGNSLSLLLIDVDKFKMFNDTFGHPAGDRVLKNVARILQEQARGSDFVARYGGEEFVVILPETGKEDALEAAERFREAIASCAWPERPITISIGVATLTSEGELQQALIDRADRALYQSKQTGRNCTTHSENTPAVWSEETTKAINELLHQLLAAESDQFSTASEKIRETMLRAYNATVESWRLLVDMKDKETEGHSERVTLHMEHLSKYVGMNADEVQYARWGAVLHDIGKVGIPDAILLKPGPLTEAEWAIMRLHPVVAQQILVGIPFLKPALTIPYCHHEKWDGTGYPRGLKGEEIPFEARLFAVIDVYDALKSDRPYRSGWPEQKVRDYLREESGKHFDPRAVEVFLSMLNQQENAIGKAA